MKPILLSALIVPLFLAARASAAEKKVVRGAPVCLDAAGKAVPCPTAIPVKPKEPERPMDGIEAAASLAVQSAAHSKPPQSKPAAPKPAATKAPEPTPAAAAVPASHPFVFKLALNAVLTVGLFAALLLLLKLKLSFASAEFEFEKEPRGPGEVARGFLKTKERPETVKAVFELYREENDVPVRSVPTDVGMPEELLEGAGWRTAISVTLPPDVHPPFEGGWALSIEGTINGKKFLAGDNPNLKPPA